MVDNASFNDTSILQLIQIKQLKLRQKKYE